MAKVCVYVDVCVPALLPVSRLLRLVGFDTAYVVGRTLHECAHQIVGLFLVKKERVSVLLSAPVYTTLK